MQAKLSSLVLFLSTVILTACGGGGGNDNPPSSTAASSGTAISLSSISSSASFTSSFSSASLSSSTSSLGIETRNEVAAQTAESTVKCQLIQPFYWEIGDKNSVLGSDSVGDDTYDANTVMSIASASKWFFAAYVAQLRQGQLTDADIAALSMRAGYINFDELSCVRLIPANQNALSVNACFQLENDSGFNNDFDENAVGKFSYNGGHFQKLAVDLGMADMNNAALKTAYQTQLGSDIELSFGPPQLAGGVSTSAAQYAIFLRKILNNQLFIHDLLGSHSTCTNILTCVDSLYTPIPINRQFDYSIGHWVENDPVIGDGSFNSTGTFGFYPWIDATKNYYGVLARKSEAGNGSDSMECGRLIRKAWMTGVAQ